MKIIIKILVLISLLVCQNVYAQGQGSSGVGTTILSMFGNGLATFNAAIELIKYASYIIGLYLMINSVFKFSQLGDSQSRVSPKTPIVMFFVGVAIFSLTSSLSIVSQTLALGDVGPGGAIAPSAGGGLDASMVAAMHGVLTFIKMVGYIAFIRGWLMLNQVGLSQGGQNASVGKGIVHICGGAAAINIELTTKLLANTFAPNVPLNLLGM